jgi:preprotein translocase subunit SecG
LFDSIDEKEIIVSILLILVLIALVISGVGLVIFIMLHSGKGTGVSDAIASSLYSSQTGTSIIEKNLDRITIVFAIIFLVSLLILMIIFPQGSIAS